MIESLREQIAEHGLDYVFPSSLRYLFETQSYGQAKDRKRILTMLDENDVVAAVCLHLEQENYTIIQRLRTTEHGTDIIATHRASWKTAHRS